MATKKPAEEVVETGGPGAEVEGEEKLQGKEGLIEETEESAAYLVEETEEGAEHLVQEIEAEAKKVEVEAEDLVQKARSEIFGSRNTSGLTHGTHAASVTGLQTDADPGYVHPAQLPNKDGE